MFLFDADKAANGGIFRELWAIVGNFAMTSGLRLAAAIIVLLLGLKIAKAVLKRYEKSRTFRQRFRYNDYTTINKLSQAFRHRFSEFFQFHFSQPDKLTTEYYRNILSQKVHLLKQGFDYSHLKSERGNTF